MFDWYNQMFIFILESFDHNLCISQPHMLVFVDICGKKDLDNICILDSLKLSTVITIIIITK